jgi:hypothetical protein
LSKFTDIEIFEILKKSIAERFLEENSAQSTDLSQWKGQEIVVFQDDLFNKTKSTVSEKWFYTYFKSDFKKLPRIDMLNLLSQYCGYKSWAHFLRQKEIEIFGKSDQVVEPFVLNRPIEPPVAEVEEAPKVELHLHEKENCNFTHGKGGQGRGRSYKR